MAPQQILSLGSSSCLGKRLSGLLALLLVFAGSTPVRAAGQQIPLAELPVSVTDRMRTAVPGATYNKATIQYEFARQVYELTGRTSNGRNLCVVMTRNGGLLAVDTDISFKEVPRDVVNTLNRWLPDFQTTSVVRSVRDGGASIWYQLEGVSQNGRKTTVEIRADGKKIMIEEL
jgi:hypothetical protein